MKQTQDKTTNTTPMVRLLDVAQSAWEQGLFAYWLIDRSALPQGWLKKHLGGLDWVDVLRGEEAQSLDDATPALLQIPPDKDRLAGFCDALYRVARYANNVALLTSASSLALLQKSLAHRARVVLPQDLEVVLRFFDTRTLPLLARLYTSVQYAAFMADIDSWHYLTRSGEVQCLPTPEEHTAPLASDSGVPIWLLDQEQEAMLIEDGMTDAVIDMLLTQGLGELQELLPHEQFNVVEPLVIAARQAGAREHAQVFEHVALKRQEQAS